MPIYLLCMSIIDLLMVFGVLNISAIVYNLGRIAVIMLALIIGLLGGSNEKGGDGPASTDELRTKKMYDACAEFVKFDFTRSYEFAFEDCAMQNYEYVPHTEKRFIYDAEYLVGAEYTGVGADKRYSTFYISSDEFNGKTAQLNNNDGLTEDFNLIFVRYVEEVGGAFKYSTVEALDYASHCGFTAQQFDHAVQITYNSNEDYIHVLYQSKHDTSYTSKKHYQVSYHFNTDSEGNHVSLRSIECNIFTDDNTKQRFVYKPIYEPTGFEDLFDMYGNLDGYYHNDDVIYGIDFAEKFSALDSACWGDEYDFIFTEKSDYGSTAYIYDSESGLVAEYKDENYERGIAAAEANDFETSMPDYFISNADKLKYYPLGDVVVDDGNRFRKYTYDNYDAYLALGGVFAVYFAPDGVNAEEFASGSVTLTIGIHHPTFEEEIEQFRIQLLRISTGSYYVNAVHFDGIYEGKEYSIDVHVGYDKYDITMPESVAVG